MSDNERITAVRSETSGTTGRSINHARNHHFIIDEPSFAGGPGEALTPEESFLSGVSACGVMLIEAFAEEDGNPVDDVEIEIRGVREEDNPADYRRVEMEFRFTGTPRGWAEHLVERFQGR